MYKSYEGISDRCHLMILVYVCRISNLFVLIVLYHPPVPSFFTRLHRKVGYAFRVYVRLFLCHVVQPKRSS